MKFRRGEIYFIESRIDENNKDGEACLFRPALIVSNDLGNESSNNVIVVYLSSVDRRPMSVHARVMTKKPSWALCEQIYCIPKTRLRDYVRTCTEEEMKGVDKALSIALSLWKGGRMNV